MTAPSALARSGRALRARFAAFGAEAVRRCGAEIVAAVLAKAGAMATARAEERAKPRRRERGEEQSEEPVGGDDAVGVVRPRKVAEAEAQEMGGSALWIILREVRDRDVRRGRRRMKVPSLLQVWITLITLRAATSEKGQLAEVAP